MKFNYFTHESEESLAPFYSKQVLTSIRFYLACILFPSLLLWPRNQFSFFVENHETPVFFPSVFILTLLFLSHLSLRYGKGEFSTVEYITGLLKKNIRTFEETQPFFTYGFINFLLFNTCTILMASPILIVASSISGIQVNLMVKSIIIIFLTSLICGLCGFINYLVFGRWKIIGYFSSRVTYGLILFGTGFINMELNPAFQLYTIYQNHKKEPVLQMDPVTFYLFLLASITVILSIISHVIISMKRNREIRK